MISVKNLQKHFEGNTHVLKGVNVEINKGDVICVIGPSGSGKSTFLRCLNMLEKPTGGQIIFEGDDLTSKKVDLNLHRQKMGMVFQQFNLFPHMTVLENMTCAPVMLKKMTKAGREKGSGASGPCRSERPRLFLSEPALRRTEAACRHRARPVYGAGRHAFR